MQRNITAKAIQFQSYLPRMMATLAAVCALCVFLYGIFLLEAVAHTANRTQAERQIRDITERLSTLEAEYLQKTATLTPEHAAALGFVPPVQVFTVVASTPQNALSLRTR